MLVLLSDMARKPEVARSMPRHLQVEVTTFCNLDCLACGRRSIVEKPAHMSFQQLQRIFAQVRPTNINLSGLGEPILNPDLFRMIRYCREQGAVVNFPTNFNVSAHMIKKLVAAGPHQIKVSIDAASAETYRQVRRVNGFQRVLDNILYLNELRAGEKLAYPEVRFNFALQRHNIEDLPDLFPLAASLGVRKVYIQDLNYFSIEDEKGSLCGIDRHYLKSKLALCAEIARKEKVSTNLDNWMRHFHLFHNKMESAKQFAANDLICYFPWVSAFVDVHGNVKPCPVFVWDKEALPLGNCFQAKFEQIWNCEEYRLLRHSARNRIRRFPICRRCVPPGIWDMKLILQKMLLRHR